VVFNNHLSDPLPITCGVPQGSFLGPLLFLLYINDIANFTKHLNYLLFADDTNIIYSDCSFNQLVNVVNSELITLSDWFRANRLSLNITKTNYMLFGFKNISQHASATFVIDNQPITYVEYTKFLGVLIDRKFTWRRHVSYISSKVSRTLYMLNRLKCKLSQPSLLQIYNSLVYPQLNYCNILWGCASKSVLNELIVLQKRAIRIIGNASYLAHTNVLAKKLGVMKLTDINVFQSALFVFKYVNNYLPSACDEFLSKSDQSNNAYSFRHTILFLIPSYRTSLREKCSLVRFSQIWNAIPNEIKTSPSLSIFKLRLKDHLFSKLN